MSWSMKCAISLFFARRDYFISSLMSDLCHPSPCQGPCSRTSHPSTEKSPRCCNTFRTSWREWTFSFTFFFCSAAQRSSTSHNIIMLIQQEEAFLRRIQWPIGSAAQRCFLEKVLNANCLLRAARPRAPSFSLLLSLYSAPFFQLHKWSMNESRKYAGASCKWGVCMGAAAAAPQMFRYSTWGWCAAFMGYFAPFPHSSLSLYCIVETRCMQRMMPATAAAAAEIAAIVIFCWINGPDALWTHALIACVFRHCFPCRIAFIFSNYWQINAFLEIFIVDIIFF